MQKQGLKILLGLAIVLFPCTFSFAQPARQLKEADSLFVNRLYTQSLEKYSQLFEAGMYSPAMLLRMSRIEEGLGHTARSLYYLNLNYLATKDESVLEKMAEIANRNNLQGYETSSSDQALLWIATYQQQISLSLLALAVFFFSLGVYQKRKSAKPIFAFSGLALSVILVVIVNQVDFTQEKGIVTQAPIYLMSGPSAGANVLAIVGPGHRLTVKGEKDVWLKVQWQNKYAYLKKNQLLPVDL